MHYHWFSKPQLKIFQKTNMLFVSWGRNLWEIPLPVETTTLKHKFMQEINFKSSFLLFNLGEWTRSSVLVSRREREREDGEGNDLSFVSLIIIIYIRVLWLFSYNWIFFFNPGCKI
jgi:hypothetical protein